MSSNPANPSGQFQPQGDAAYQTGVAPPAQDPKRSGTGGRTRNTLAIVAFIAAVVGFIFAIIEGAYILGWILLPIAFVLSIIALVLRDKPKKMALWALVISMVGFVAGGIAFATSVGKAIDESFGSDVTPTVVATTDADATDQTEDESDAMADEAAESDASEQGSRENPYPLGTTVAAGDWEITLNSFTADATEQVMAENEFNDPPADGSAYALANVTVKRLAAEQGSPFEITFSYVTGSGNVVMSHDSFAVIPDELSTNELFEGAAATGNIGFDLPAEDTGVLRVQPDIFGDTDLFFATQ